MNTLYILACLALIAIFAAYGAMAVNEINRFIGGNEYEKTTFSSPT